MASHRHRRAAPRAPALSAARRSASSSNPAHGGRRSPAAGVQSAATARRSGLPATRVGCPRGGRRTGTGSRGTIGGRISPARLRPRGGAVMKRMACWVVGLAVIWSLFVSATARAVERPFRIVIDGGLAIAKLRDVEFPYAELESMKSFTASAGVSWRLSDDLAVEPRVSYLVKGISFGEVGATDNAGNLIGKAELLYPVDVLEIAVFLRWNAPVRGSIRPSRALGPFVSFVLNERFKYTGAIEES